MRDLEKDLERLQRDSEAIRDKYIETGDHNAVDVAAFLAFTDVAMTEAIRRAMAAEAEVTRLKTAAVVALDALRSAAASGLTYEVAIRDIEGVLKAGDPA